MADTSQTELTSATTGQNPQVGNEVLAGKDSIAQLADITKQRAATYDLLARLFRVEVDQHLLDDLLGRTFPTQTGDEAVDKGYGLIARYLSNVWEGTLTELAVDYVRTFIGHGMDAYSAAYPYESVYTSKRRLLMQEARSEVMHLYHQNKVVRDDSWHEGEDHVALELEYMQILCSRLLHALDDGDEDEAMRLLSAQRSFLTDHLCAWVPMMTADMKKFSQVDLYQGLAWLTEGFLADDLAFLEELLGDDEGDAQADADEASADVPAAESE